MYVGKIDNYSTKPKYDAKNKNVTFGTNYKGFPDWINASINETCNLKCHYCPNSFLPKPVKEHLFPMDLYKKLLSCLQQLDYNGIFCFHRYNEPLLTRKAEEYIEFANKYIPEAETRLYTNGMFLTKERLESIKSAGGLKTIIVTEHTPLKSFIERISTLDESLLGNIFVRRAQDMHLVNRGGLMEGQRELKTKDLPCGMPARNLVFDSYGNAIFCPDDYYGSIIVGDLKKQTPIEIVESKEFQSVSQALLRGERSRFPVCANCNRENSVKESDKIPAIEFIKANNNG